MYSRASDPMSHERSQDNTGFYFITEGSHEGRRRSNNGENNGENLKKMRHFL